MIFLPVLIQCSDNKKEEMMPPIASVLSAAVVRGGQATPSQIPTLTAVADSAPQGAAILSLPAVPQGAAISSLPVVPTSIPAAHVSDVGPTPHTVTHSPVDGSGPTQTTISPSKTLGTGIGAGTVLGTSDQVQ